MATAPIGTAHKLLTLPFTIAVVLLGSAAILAGPVARWMDLKRDKAALPLKAALGALDVDAILPYRVVERHVLEPIVVEARVASGISAAAMAPTVTIDVEWAQQLTEMISSELDDETLKISGSAQASVQASLAAALEVLQSELERVEFDHEAAVTQISVAGSLLASLAASLEGQLKIETEDGAYVLVTGPGGVQIVEKR